MNYIKILAYSRIKYYKSRTIVTAIAMILTTALLMAVATAGAGLIDLNKKNAEQSLGNTHAYLRNISMEQIEMLKNHMDVEAVSYKEYFGSVIKDKINATLNYSESLLGDIKGIDVVSGTFPKDEYDIAAPPAFLERLGYKAEIGQTISLSFRVQDEGEIITKDFKVVGLLKQLDISDLNINDIRIVYSAVISKELADNMIAEKEHIYTASICVKGMDRLNYNQIQQKIENVAADINLDKNNVSINSSYLMLITDPGMETITVVVIISLIIIIFSGLVIYSIYYVSIIANIQELGKLKALGATRKQMKKLMLKEGFTIAAISIPIGIIAGYIIASVGIYTIFNEINGSLSVGNISNIKVDMFSVPIVICVVAVTFFTIYISLIKPMRMTAKISPIEAIHYQEEGIQKKVLRNGYNNINISKLCYANLSRNKKRTTITIVTMGLSCVLFMAIAGLMNSMSITDFVKRTLEKGDFAIELYYSVDDETYLENNLDSLEKKDFFNEDMIKKIKAIPGVTNINTHHAVLSDIDLISFEDEEKISVGAFTKEDIGRLKDELKRGDIDYDKMVKENGIIFTWNSFFEYYDLSIGDTIPLTLYNGDEKVTFNATLMASVATADETFIMPKEVMDRLITNINTTTNIYISVDPDYYENVKLELKKIEDGNLYFRMISMDEEEIIADSSIKMIKYPLYIILLIVGAISFMNLINTMVTSIITRKKELGILQAVGMSNKQLTRMIQKEGFVFTIGTLICALTVGNIFGYIIFLWGKNTGFMSVVYYHYPITETIVLIDILIIGQMFITFFVNRNIHKESLVERMRHQD